MSKLTVEGLLKLLKAIEREDDLERIVLFLFADGSGSLEDSEESIIKDWDSLDEMFETLTESVLTDEDTQTKLAAKFN